MCHSPGLNFWDAHMAFYVYYLKYKSHIGRLHAQPWRWHIFNIFRSTKQIQAGGVGCDCSQDCKPKGQEEGKRGEKWKWWGFWVWRRVVVVVLCTADNLVKFNCTVLAMHLVIHIRSAIYEASWAHPDKFLETTCTIQQGGVSGDVWYTGYLWELMLEIEICGWNYCIWTSAFGWVGRMVPKWW